MNKVVWKEMHRGMHRGFLGLTVKLNAAGFVATYSGEAIAKPRTVGVSPTGAGRGRADRSAVTTPVGEDADGTVEGFAIVPYL